jgi:nucleoside-diphosphate-sugar epimerase
MATCPKTIIEEDVKSILKRTDALWPDLTKARIFLTGGTGFYGSWLIESFIQANLVHSLGAELVVLSRDPSAFFRRNPRLATANGVHLHQGDVSQFDFPEGHFSHVIHAASDLSSTQPKNPVALIETALNGCQRVTKLAAERGAKRFLFASSGAVYGPMAKGREHLNEEAPVSPMPIESKSAYMESKRLGELVCALECEKNGIAATIARGFAFMGPYLPLELPLAAPAFLKAALCGKEIVIQGNGKTVRSYLYGADLAIWLWTILLRGQHARPYNVGSDLPITISQLAKATATVCGSQASIRVLGHLQAHDTVEVYLPDISRSRDELGLDVFTPLEESLRRTALYYSQIPNP